MKDKLSLGDLSTPDILRSKKLRYSIVLIFIASMIAPNLLDIQLPVFLIITAIGVAFMTIFDEELFHRYLCPYGTILRFSSKPSRFMMKVDEENCIGCGRCQEMCPTKTIETLETEKRQIQNEECLKCFECQDVCPVDCIEYQKKS